MLSAKEAVHKARDLGASILEEFQPITIEELERVEDEWRVTIGYHDPAYVRNPISAMIAVTQGEQQRPNRYKVMHIDAETGDFKAMKMRLFPDDQSPD